MSAKAISGCSRRDFRIQSRDLTPTARVPACFNQGRFSEDGTMLLSEWMAHTPPEVLMKNFGLDREALAKLPTGALYIFPGAVPTNTVAPILRAMRCSSSKPCTLIGIV
jgi:hypothetical protein